MTQKKESMEKQIQKELQKELGIKNIHATPYLEKVVINTGLGRMSQQASFNDKILPEIKKELATITGQHPSAQASKKSIAGFKLREGQTIGLKITLRGARMYDFINKINKSVYPRVRDFKGIDLKNVDKQGNLNLGFKEHVVFPEVSQDASLVSFGFQVTCVARNVKDAQQAKALYTKLGFMFKKNNG